MGGAGLSAGEARRIALAAQGFAERRPAGRIDARHLRRVLDRVGLIQIDSVNVLARSHYLPFFSRLGPYRSQLLDDLAYRRRELFEYWGHAASFIPTRHHSLFRHRMEGWMEGQRWRWEFEEQFPRYLEGVLEEVAARGPLTPEALDDPGERRGPWWGWGRGKLALELLFGRGEVSVAERRNFERYYDLTERVLPPETVNGATPTVEEARRELLLLSARSLGVGTAKDLADYYRLPLTASKPLLRELVAEGALQQVGVEGWREPAYLDPAARLPRRVEARALLSPFDSLVWFRDRDERLFDFHYRIEIYTPEPKRQFGYYVLPFLLGERLVGRVDLKADRAASALLARAAHLEPGAHPGETAEALAAELRSMADWLGLERVVVEPRGDLAPALRDVVGVGPHATWPGTAVE
ncbi:MAG: winged helix-turn-helix domain-containing protein [Dehalococcoidia bacterium]|nr:winged helix-turn-helix domain-containing protein [Dehalococcoidia bacterium]